MVSHRRLSDSKFTQISRTLLRILADINNAVIQMISMCPLISKSSRPCTYHLVTVTRAPISTGIQPSLSGFTVVSLPSQGPGTYLSFCFLSILLCRQPGRQNLKFSKFTFFVIVVDYYKVQWSGRNQMIRLYLIIAKEFVSHSGWCIYHFVVWLNFTFLHNSQCITLPI